MIGSRRWWVIASSPFYSDKRKQTNISAKEKKQLTFPDLPSHNIHNLGTYSPEKQITCNYKKSFEKKRMSSRSIHSFVSKFSFPGCIYTYIYIYIWYIFFVFLTCFVKVYFPKTLGKPIVLLPSKITTVGCPSTLTIQTPTSGPPWPAWPSSCKAQFQPQGPKAEA